MANLVGLANNKFSHLFGVSIVLLLFIFLFIESKRPMRLGTNRNDYSAEQSDS